MTVKPASARPSNDPELEAANRRFYDNLWSASRLIGPERFNTWPLVARLAADCPRRVEVGPGMRPRLPLVDTCFCDISAPALATLSRHGGLVHEAVISNLPFAKAAFDLVCALDIIEHVADDETAIAELARVAAPKGVVLLSTPLHPEYWSRFDEIVGHHRRYRPEALCALLDRHGLEIEQSAVFGMKPRSSRLSTLGLWFVRRDPIVAMWIYNLVLMPLSLRLQKPLELVEGLVATEGVDEIFLVCRKRG